VIFRFVPPKIPIPFLTLLFWMSDYTSDRRGVCRRFDVSMPVLRPGGFQWTMERREHRQETCCLPPIWRGKNGNSLS
jgi:hypothetical protein